MNGASAITELKKKFRKPDSKALTDKQLSEILGISIQMIGNWRERDEVTTRQFAGLVASARKASHLQAEKGAIRPIVEYFPIEKWESEKSGRFNLFSSTDRQKIEHPYLAGLKGELDSHHGVYVFFDSRGRAIYAGKSSRQTLWKEMNLVFNRDRGDVQGIKRVAHPLRKQDYKTSEEKTRQIRRRSVALHELAVYFSAYQVANGMINELEAMLVRSFANDLLNVRMEQFNAQRARKKAISGK